MSDFLRWILGFGGGYRDDFRSEKGEHRREQGAYDRCESARKKSVVSGDGRERMQFNVRHTAEQGNDAENHEGSNCDHLDERKPELELPRSSSR